MVAGDCRWWPCFWRRLGSTAALLEASLHCRPLAVGQYTPEDILSVPALSLDPPATVQYSIVFPGSTAGGGIPGYLHCEYPAIAA